MLDGKHGETRHTPPPVPTTRILGVIARDWNGEARFYDDAEAFGVSVVDDPEALVEAIVSSPGRWVERERVEAIFRDYYNPEADEQDCPHA